jgi:gamma-glutamyltranspeptidase / glutathione hydrolase
MKHFIAGWLGVIAVTLAGAEVPVTVEPVTAAHGMVVAGHPQAAAIGAAVLAGGGNAIDAAVATSLALGVAEPYASGFGGKLMLLYYEAKSGQTFVVDAMDACGSAIDVPAYRQRGEDAPYVGYSAVCVPGLGAGLWTAHQKWGARKWADDVRPAVALARAGFRVLPKSRDFMAEQEKKLRGGDAEIARLYLPGGELPVTGSLLANEDLARTLERYAQEGRDAIYRGPIAGAIVAAAQRGGGVLTAADFARYEPRVTEPVTIEFRGHRLVGAPPPASGPALFFAIMKVLETETLTAPLRSAANLDTIGRVWRVVQPQVSRVIGDVSESRFLVEKLLAPDSIAAIRAKALAPAEQRKKAAGASRGAGNWPALADIERGPGARFPIGDDRYYESAMAATTHFIVVDAQGNIVCATQSLSLHFGAGVVAPGTGFVLNDSMSNFAFADPKSLNAVAPGKRSRSTIAPTIVFRAGRPEFALGIPGAARIPTAMLQALLDHLVLGRSLADAIGDTRVHFVAASRRDEEETFEAEQSFPAAEADALRARGWKVVLPEATGRGRHFGGINAIEFNRDGTLTGYADPRRTNVAVGY